MVRITMENHGMNIPQLDEMAKYFGEKFNTDFTMSIDKYGVVFIGE